MARFCFRMPFPHPNFSLHFIIVDPIGSADTLTSWRSHITLDYTWLFISTRCVFFFFLLWVAYRYGHVKLSPNPDEQPEFTTGSYFMMIFAAGVAVALFVYGVAEPLWHQNSHYLAMQSYRTQDEIDQFAINMSKLKKIFCLLCVSFFFFKSIKSS